VQASDGPSCNLSGNSAVYAGSLPGVPVEQ